MEKFLKWLQKNLKWICLILVVLLFLKSCQSCSRSNEITFEKQKNEKVIDSLNHEIIYRDNLIMLYQDTVNVLKNQIENNKNMIDALNNDKKSYQKISETLAQKEKKRK